MKSSSRDEADLAYGTRLEFRIEAPDEFHAHHLEMVPERGMRDPDDEDAATKGIRVRVPGVELANQPGPQRLNLRLPIAFLKLELLE